MPLFSPAKVPVWLGRQEMGQVLGANRSLSRCGTDTTRGKELAQRLLPSLDAARYNGPVTAIFRRPSCTKKRCP